MKFLTAGISLGLVSLAALTVPAGAADMPGQRGSSKDYGQAAVPVPAPVPYEDHYKWYIGAGVGFAAKSTGTLTGSTGINTTAFEDQNGPVHGSVFAGRYITPSIRVELGMDARAKMKVASGTSVYAVRYLGDGELVSPGSQNFNDYRVSHDEEAHLQTNTYMLNAYYEFMHGQRIRPYVGAGIGFATNHLNRSMTETSTCYSGGNTVTDPAGTLGACNVQGDLPTGSTTSGGVTSTGIGLAATLMAGATFDISARTHLDVGYRFTFIGGKTVQTLNDSLWSVSTLDLGNRTDHELRTAVRFDLW